MTDSKRLFIALLSNFTFVRDIVEFDELRLVLAMARVRSNLSRVRFYLASCTFAGVDNLLLAEFFSSLSQLGLTKGFLKNADALKKIDNLQLFSNLLSSFGVIQSSRIDHYGAV